MTPADKDNVHVVWIDHRTKDGGQVKEEVINAYRSLRQQGITVKEAVAVANGSNVAEFPAFLLVDMYRVASRLAIRANDEWAIGFFRNVLFPRVYRACFSPELPPTVLLDWEKEEAS